MARDKDWIKILILQEKRTKSLQGKRKTRKRDKSQIQINNNNNNNKDFLYLLHVIYLSCLASLHHLPIRGNHRGQ